MGSAIHGTTDTLPMASVHAKPSQARLVTHPSTETRPAQPRGALQQLDLDPLAGRESSRRRLARSRTRPRRASRSARASPAPWSAGRASRRRADRGGSGSRGRDRAPWRSPRRGSPSPAGRGASAAPSSARIAGRTKRSNVTIAETGLPGSPKTSVPDRPHPRRRSRGGRRMNSEVGRLAGAQGDPPEHLLDAERLERGPDVVVLADRDAARDDDDVAVERRLEHLPRRLTVVGHDPRRDQLRAGRGDQAPRACTRSSCESSPARAGSPGSRSSSPVVSTVTRGRRAHATSRDARPRPSRRPPPGRSRCPAADHRLPRLDVLARPPDVRARPRARPRSPPARGHRRCPRPGRRRRRPRGPSHRSRSRTPRRPGARARPGCPARDSSATGSRPGAAARLGEVGGADGVAVHRRAVEARDRIGAGDVLRQHPPERVARPDPLRRRAAPRRAPAPARERARYR